MKGKAEEWMRDDAADAAATMAFPTSKPCKSCFRLTKQNGEPAVQVFAKTRGPTEVVFVRMPRQTAKRLKAMAKGGHSVAVAAIVEQALDELERDRQQLIVEQA